MMAAYQCIRFLKQPMLSHERAVTRISRHLLETKDQGLIYEVNKSKGLECFVDIDFAESWSPSDLLNPENVSSRIGFVITCTSIPIF